MGPLSRIPRRYYPIYEEGQAAARTARLTNPDTRTKILDEVTARRKERDHQQKIERTMALAREYTAMRLNTNCSPYPGAA